MVGSTSAWYSYSMEDNRFIPSHIKTTPAMTSITAKVPDIRNTKVCILTSENNAEAIVIGIANKGSSIVIPIVIKTLIVNFALFSLNAGFMQNIPTLIAVTESARINEYAKKNNNIEPPKVDGYMKYKRTGIITATGSKSIED